MEFGNRHISDLKARLTREFRRDKRKAIVLVALFAVACLLIGRALLTCTAPERAAAAGGPAGAGGLVPGGGSHGTGGVASLLGPDRSGDAARLEYLAGMNRTISRDLFRPNPAYFPPPSSDNGGAGAGDSGWFAAVRQRVLEKQKAQSERLARIQEIRRQAGELSLTSTMLAGSPAAVINGQIVRQGELIGGFKVEAIGSKKCTLSKDGVQVELTMDE